MAYRAGTAKADDPNVTSLYGERTVRTSCNYFLKHITPTANILDLGCGPGTITSDLAALAPQGRTIGVDNSEGVIAQAKATYAAPNLSYVVGNALSLSEYKDDTFDIVHCHMLLVHIADATAVLKEMYRVCKPGGFVAARESSPGIVTSLKPDLPQIREYWTRATVIMEKMHAHPKAGRELAGWAKEAGMEGAEVKAGAMNNPSHAHRCKGEPKQQAIQYGMANDEELDAWAKAWDEWEETEGHEFVFETGELLCWKKS